MANKSLLNRRICDIEGGENTQTYKEFLEESEDYFEMERADLEGLEKVGQLGDYIKFIDDLWSTY